MKEKKMSRRKAMARLTKIVAMAAGLSTTQVRRLFGLEKATPTMKTQKPVQKVTPVQKATLMKRTRDIKKLQNVRTSNKNVKILKLMLQKNRLVFESEFGRITPAYKVTDVNNIPGSYRRFISHLRPDFIQEGSSICPVHAGGFGSDLAQCGAGLVCGENFSGVTGVVSGSSECNHCTQDGCSGHLLCFPPYSCGEVSCGTRLTTEFHITSSFLNQHKNDPYVQALFEEFNVPTSQALAHELQTMLQQSRQGLR